MDIKICNVMTTGAVDTLLGYSSILRNVGGDYIVLVGGDKELENFTYLICTDKECSMHYPVKHSFTKEELKKCDVVGEKLFENEKHREEA